MVIGHQQERNALLSGSPQLTRMIDRSDWWVLLMLVTVLGLAGCKKENKPEAGSDFVHFFQEKGAEYGLRFKHEASQPSLQAQWTVQSDPSGFIIHLTGVTFTDVDRSLRVGLGSPIASEDKDKAGQPHAVWAAADAGAAVQVMGEPGGVQVICVKGTSGETNAPGPAR